MQIKKYYVYRHIRPDKNIPFYIGIGVGRRYKYKTGRNSIWNRIVNKNNGVFISEILFENLSLEEAFKKEIEFISLYGRLDLNTGVLANMTAGGDGCTDMNPAGRQKISKANTGKKRTDEMRLKMSKHRIGKKHSEETKLKIRTAQLGYKNHRFGMKLSEEQKIKMGIYNLVGCGNPNYKGLIFALNSNTFSIEHSFKSPDEIRCFLNLPNTNNLSQIYSNIKGNIKTAYGYVWTRKSISQLPSYVLEKRRKTNKRVIDTITNKTYESVKELAANTGLKYQFLVERLGGTRVNNTQYKYF